MSEERRRTPAMYKRRSAEILEGPTVEQTATELNIPLEMANDDLPNTEDSASGNPSTPDPGIPFGLIGSGLVISFTLWTRRYFFRKLRAAAAGPGSVESGNALSVDPMVLQPAYARFIPISHAAIDTLRVLTTSFAYYLVFLVLFNIEVLVLYPLVLKQRGYSHLYRELGTPVVGPVFMTHMKQGVFFLLDGLVTPWTLVNEVFGAAVAKAFA